jgi:hypothetical protein
VANIKGFDTPDLTLRPTEIGVDATAAAARRIGASYSQAADALNQTGQHIASTVRDVGNVVENYETHREVSTGSKTFADLQLGLTKAWEDNLKGADPNDPSVAAKFRETVIEPQLEKFKENFNTERAQNWADTKANAFRDHMYAKTSADMSTMAGIAVNSNLRDVTTSMSNTALLDPSSVGHLLADADHSIGGVVASSPNLSPVDAARVRDEIGAKAKAAIVKNGAIGAIQKSGDPEKTADEWTRKYPEFISGDEARALAQNARSQIRARNYDYETSRRRAKDEAQDKSTELSNQYLIDVRSRDPRLQGDPTATKILNDPSLTKQDKNNLLNYVDRTMKPETDSRLSQQTFVGLLRDMRDPNADADKIMQKAWDARLMDPGKPGSMTEHDFNQFRQEVVARKTPEGAALERDRGAFFKNYGSSIAGPSYTPAIGDPKVYNAEMDARRMEGMLRQKGLDPHLAYDPASEYFLGKPERLQKWQQSMQVDLQTRAQAPAGQGNPAAAPGRPEVPYDLRGIAALQYSKSRNMWRDDTSGKLYDASGKEVGK